MQLSDSNVVERPLLEHIDELRSRVVRILLSIVIISAFIFIFSFREFNIGDVTMSLPYPDVYNNMATGILERIQELVLPSYVDVVLTTPGQALMAQLYVAIMIGIIASMPVIIREVNAFVSPGLHPSERKIIRNVSGPAILLFLVGSFFALYFVAPYTMNFLYRYGLALNALTFITVDELIGFVVFFVIAFGLSFQLPIAMWVLTRVGIVEPRIWRDNWRYVFVALVVFGAIITPDGSGITMWFIAIPMMILYVIGYVSTRSMGTEGMNRQTVGDESQQS